MSHVRIHHVFYVLMGLSALVAFLVPPKAAARFQPRVEVLFAPVARPAGALARSLTGRVSPAVVEDRRADPEIREENEQLRAEVLQLNARVKELARRDRELAKVGVLKDRCLLTRVIGGDSGGRDSIGIAAGSLDGLKPDMYVLTSEGIVGRIDRTGYGGSQVKLATDPGFRVIIEFRRFEKQFLINLKLKPVVVQGIGNGRMAVRALSLADLGLDAGGKPLDPVAGPGVQEGDYVVIHDPDSPSVLDAYPIGKVTAVVPRSDARLYAEIQIRPMADLQKVTEVMVLNKASDSEALTSQR